MDTLSRSLPLIQDSVTGNWGRNSINNDSRFDSFSSSVNSTFTASIDSSRVPVHAYGATALSASGRESNVVLSDFDPFPVATTCPNCQQVIETNVKYRAGKLTFMMAALVGILTCGVGCFIPFCVRPLKDAYHSCPKCSSTIGVYRRKTGCI